MTDEYTDLPLDTEVAPMSLQSCAEVDDDDELDDICEARRPYTRLALRLAWLKKLQPRHPVDFDDDGSVDEVCADAEDLLGDWTGDCVEVQRCEAYEMAALTMEPEGLLETMMWGDEAVIRLTPDGRDAADARFPQTVE
jgi:hypothetical protein